MLELHLKIFGEVQGVNFRYDSMLKAQDLDLAGWVRNVPDGTVEILAQGEKKDLEKLVEWARSGPTFARVEKSKPNGENQRKIMTALRLGIRKHCCIMRKDLKNNSNFYHWNGKTNPHFND